MIKKNFHDPSIDGERDATPSKKIFLEMEKELHHILIVLDDYCSLASFDNKARSILPIIPLKDVDHVLCDNL